MDIYKCTTCGRPQGRLSFGSFQLQRLPGDCHFSLQQLHVRFSEPVLVVGRALRSDFYCNINLCSMDRTLRCGLLSTVSNIPAGFTHSTIIVAGDGINNAMNQWGSLMRSVYGTERRATDFTVDYLGYYTDNGPAQSFLLSHICSCA